ncbi:MAG: hypothetical protein JWN27_4456 [Candidatus Eremiobacteraeota bacterium]|nr:hypothetical protein [Candidatus Eremiobacteraeota bacterium]
MIELVLAVDVPKEIKHTALLSVIFQSTMDRATTCGRLCSVVSFVSGAHFSVFCAALRYVKSVV